MRHDSDPALSWIGLSSIPGVGRITFRKLVDLFESPAQVLSASSEDLRRIGGLSGKLTDAIGAFPWQQHAEQELAKAAQSNVRIILASDSAFPENLRDAPDAPLFLYVRGELISGDANALAIVGTRKPTHYGKTVTRRFASELASSGFTIVSGMARGIDTEAHRGAIEAGGRTIAVLGCGIDVAYPPENRGLMEEICRTGAVVSENPFGTRPEAGYFPARNRIISGLSRGVIIVEAAEDSGSLITAQYAREQKRKLYAVPGNIGSPVSRGTNSLIRQGAVLIERTADILMDLGSGHIGTATTKASRPLPELSPEEHAVLCCIADEPRHIDAIMTESRTTAGRLGGVLVTLELKGLTQQLPGKYFIRK